MAGRPLGQLAAAVGGRLEPGDAGALLITDVTHDSRTAGPDSLYVAVAGATTDGHRFVADAVAAGASAVCVSRPVETVVPQLVVADTRKAMGTLASLAHGEPSLQVKVVGVTGTNGKTTVTHYVEAIAVASGLVAGLIGTIGARAAGDLLPLERTTPEATDFQRLLALMRDRGCELVAAEVSSHSLTLERVRATRFEVAAFTNLSQDHLDFHGDMARYRAAKESLFHEYEVGTAVVNVDDPAGREMAGRIDLPLVTIGRGADAGASKLRATSEGIEFVLSTPWGAGTVTAPVTGRFNVDNAVMAAVSCLAAGLGFDHVIAAMRSLPVVPGRFERVSGDDPVTIIVDYAHTPAGVSHAIATARDLGPGRVIALVGAGGDRDREKRPLMGEALSAADVAVVTSDNPRSEPPEEIAAAVAAGSAEGTDLRIELDRARAIRLAVAEAADGDIVLVLGRGHEPYQEVSGEKIPFDDRVVAARILAELRSSANFGAGTGSITP